MAGSNIGMHDALRDDDFFACKNIPFLNKGAANINGCFDEAFIAADNPSGNLYRAVGFHVGAFNTAGNANISGRFHPESGQYIARV